MCMKHAFAKTALLFLASLCMAASPGWARDGQPAANPAAAPAQVLDLPAGTQDAAPATPGSLQFIGTATVLIHYHGLTILTDPNFLHKGERAPLGYGLSSERLTDPAIELGALPQVDFVLLSHLHGDHFDPLVQEKLDRNLPIITTPEAAPDLQKMGFTRVHALARWDAIQVNKGRASVRVTAMPGRHGPGAAAALLPQVMGSMLDFSAQGNASNYRMYISGDTLVYDDIREIPKRYPDVDLALLHLGGTRILGFLKVTMDGKDGVEMLQIIAPREAIPIHYNDYGVFKSPLSDFQKEVAGADLKTKITYLKHGESYPFRLGK